MLPRILLIGDNLSLMMQWIRSSMYAINVYYDRKCMENDVITDAFLRGEKARRAVLAYVCDSCMVRVLARKHAISYVLCDYHRSC